MPGSHDQVARDAPDREKMTNKELHDKFARMMSEQVNDIENRFTEAIDGVEKMIDTKLDTKFTKLIARLPAQHAPLQHSHSHRHHDVHDVFCFRADKLLVLVLLPLQLRLLLLLLTSARTTTTRLITRRRWNRKRPMNSQLEVHVPTFATVDTNHPLRYAMTNMCLNLNRILS